jgi:hypothetical protein
LDDLAKFDLEGYRFQKGQSTDTKLVFGRSKPEPQSKRPSTAKVAGAPKKRSKTNDGLSSAGKRHGAADGGTLVAIVGDSNADVGGQSTRKRRKIK